jgi:hypothetical protein
MGIKNAKFLVPSLSKKLQKSLYEKVTVEKLLHFVTKVTIPLLICQKLFRTNISATFQRVYCKCVFETHINKVFEK